MVDGERGLSEEGSMSSCLEERQSLASDVLKNGTSPSQDVKEIGTFPECD